MLINKHDDVGALVLTINFVVLVDDDYNDDVDIDDVADKKKM